MNKYFDLQFVQIIAKLLLLLLAALPLFQPHHLQII